MCVCVFLALFGSLPLIVGTFSLSHGFIVDVSALGSALATIGLTVPIIVGLSVAFDWTLELGLDPKGITLLALTLLVSAMSLSTGRTTVLQGAVHLVIFAFFLFTSFAP